MKYWQKWAYYSQWVIAVGAVAQCFETAIRLRLTYINFWFYIFIFSCTLLQYMWHFRFFSFKKPSSERQFFFSAHRKFLWVQLAITSIFLCVSLFIIGRYIIIPLLVMGLFTQAYTFFLYRSRRNGIFKYNGLFKILTLTFIWAGVTGILPIFANHTNWLQANYIFHFAMRWLMMLAICLPFDIRDVKEDQRNGTITIPAIIGVKNTLVISYISIILNILLVAISVIWGWNTWPVAITNGIANMVLIASIYYSSKHINDEFSWFLLDGNFIIHTLIVCAILFI